MAEPLALLLACAHETALIRTHLQVQQHTTGPAGRLWQGTLLTSDVLLMQCGMGPLRATQAARWLADQHSFSALLSLGFAGGLHADLATGDGILVTAVRDAVVSVTSNSLQPDARLSHIAAMALAQAGLVGHTGTLLSAPEVIAQATAKQHLGQQTGALAVDMESYSLGHIAAQLHLPFATLRIIFDPVTEDVTFPVGHCMTATGDLRAGALVSSLIRHPHLCTHLPHWWWQAHRAGRQLQRWVKHFFVLLAQGA